jgi:hypothetical protein
MIINGREVLFLKLDRSKFQPQYLKTMAYRLLDSPQERSQILQALKHIGQQIVPLAAHDLNSSGTKAIAATG